MKKKALITGISGQDGSYLSEYLLTQDYDVYGIIRRHSVVENQDSRINHLYKDIHTEYGDLLDVSSLERLFQTIKPDEIYNLAAMSHVGISFDIPQFTTQTNALGVVNMLEAFRKFTPNSKLYQASSSVGGDTPIMIRDKNGIRLINIENLYKEFNDNSKIKILSVDKTSFKVDFKNISGVSKHKSSQCYEVKYKCGGKMVITGNHSVIILDKDGNLSSKRFDELKENDYLLSFDGVDYKNSKLKNITFNWKRCHYVKIQKKEYGVIEKDKTFNIPINENTMRLFGYYLAEGSLYIKGGKNKSSVKHAKCCFTFNINEKEYHEDVINILKSQFDIQSSIRHDINENRTQIEFSKKPFSLFILESFGTGSHDKFLPNWIWDLPRDLKIQFLLGYACGDATIMQCEQLKFTTCSYGLATQIIWLIKSCAIPCAFSKRISKEYWDKKRNYMRPTSTGYDICIPRSYVNEIFSNIGYGEMYGQKSCSDKCLESRIAKKLYGKPSAIFAKECVSKKNILERLDLTDNSVLKKISKSNICVKKIKSIIPLNLTYDVYDVEVPDSQIFIGGNVPILLHNSEIFGESVDEDGYQREETKKNPVSPYGCAKLFGYNIIRNYRKAYKLFLSNGILFNHGSPRRGGNFVEQKVVKNAVLISLGIIDKLELGNLDSYRDWGHSKDYIKAMAKILNYSKPDDFVIATGKTHCIREMCEYVFSKLKLDYRDYVIQNPKYLRPEELPYLRGDSTKAQEKLDWHPFYTFETMLDEMIDYWLEFFSKKENIEKSES